MRSTRPGPLDCDSKKHKSGREMGFDGDDFDNVRCESRFAILEMRIAPVPQAQDQKRGLHSVLHVRRQMLHSRAAPFGCWPKVKCRTGEKETWKASHRKPIAAHAKAEPPTVVVIIDRDHDELGGGFVQFSIYWRMAASTPSLVSFRRQFPKASAKPSCWPRSP